MENPFHYRNKAQYPLGIDKNGEPIIGVFANRTHEVIPMQKCLIQNSQSEEIAKFVLRFIKDNNISIYNEKTGKGLFRHIVIKVGIKTNEVMCVLVVNGNQIISNIVIGIDNQIIICIQEGIVFQFAGAKSHKNLLTSANGFLIHWKFQLQKVVAHSTGESLVGDF